MTTPRSVLLSLALALCLIGQACGGSDSTPATDTGAPDTATDVIPVDACTVQCDPGYVEQDCDCVDQDECSDGTAACEAPATTASNRIHEEHYAVT